MHTIALYPFNKITQGVIRFRDLSEYRIKCVIDFVLHVGEDAGQLVEGKHASIPIVNDVFIALEGVDCLVLNDPGTSFGNNQVVYNNKNLTELWRILVITAHQKNIRIISVHEIFDQDTLAWMQEHQIKIEVESQIPQAVEKRFLQEYNLTAPTEIDQYLKYFEVDEKMLQFNKNICKIGIFATKGCLGKFTAKMTLFREIKQAGYKVSTIITEPTANLFQQPGGDIMKFISKYPLSYYSYYINAVIREAELSGNEFFLLSGQGSLLPNNNMLIATTKLNYLHALNPDYVFLVVGYDDDERIQNCIDILRIFGGGKQPFALLVPNKIEVNFGEYLVKTEEEIAERIEHLKLKFGIRYVDQVFNVNQIATELVKEYEAKRHISV